MHGRRREGEGADLELKLARLSLKVPWVPWIDHHIKLHCHVDAAEVLPSFKTPPTHTHTRPLRNFMHSAMKSLHTQKHTPHAYAYTHLYNSIHIMAVRKLIQWLYFSLDHFFYSEKLYLGKECTIVLSDQPNPFTAFHR